MDRAQSPLGKGRGIHIGHPVNNFKECKGLKQLQLLREAIVLGRESLILMFKPIRVQE